MIIVSVIIPTYGDPHYLRQSIESVINQTLQELELIVVDDNDPLSINRSKTEEIVNDYIKRDDRIRYIKHDRNKNGAAARNTGLQVAQGHFISFLDSDDIYISSRLEKCVAVMERSSKNIAGVYTGCEFRRNGKKYNSITNVKPGNFMLETLAGTFMFCTGSNIFIRKEIIDKLGGFDETFLRHQDYEFLVRLFEEYDLEAIQEVLVIKNNDNLNAASAEKLIDIKKKYLEKYKRLIERYNDPEKNYIYRSHWVFVAETALRNGQIKLSKECYKKASRYGGLKYQNIVRGIALLLKTIIKT